MLFLSNFLNLSTVFRQDNLWYNWGFRCCCEVCKEEEINVDHIKTYQMYENLQREVKKCLENQKNQDRKSRLENIKKEVSYHKGMWFSFATLRICSIFVYSDCLFWLWTTVPLSSFSPANSDEFSFLKAKIDKNVIWKFLNWKMNWFCSKKTMNMSFV